MEFCNKNRTDALKYLRSLVFDLDEKIDFILNVKQLYFEKYYQLNLPNGTDHPYLDLNTLINEMIVSYVGPAYHYNLYIDNMIRDLEWNEIKYGIEESKWDSSILRRIKYQADAQSVLLTIKMALDRLVGVFSYYFRGISTNTTFGRYGDNGNPHGLMAKVNELKEMDDLMAYIDENYHQWIKIAVSPRDTIVHFNDLQIFYHFDSETGFELPLHGSARLFVNGDPGKNFGFSSLRELSENWYLFFKIIMNGLMSRNLSTDKPRI